MMVGFFARLVQRELPKAQRVPATDDRTYVYARTSVFLQQEPVPDKSVPQEAGPMDGRVDANPTGLDAAEPRARDSGTPEVRVP